ncbi:MAG: hypothetical protein JRI75_04920 [Deltaproteobacteria bacterium]|nr:hypothetical protein [Deltaproteobacteria bacterium]
MNNTLKRKLLRKLSKVKGGERVYPERKDLKNICKSLGLDIKGNIKNSDLYKVLKSAKGAAFVDWLATEEDSEEKG